MSETDPIYRRYFVLIFLNIAFANCVNYYQEECRTPIDCQLATWAANRTGINPPRATNLQGIPIPSLTASQSVYPSGVILAGEFRLLDKLSSFNMERIPTRVVHAKGAGAHGHFIVTNDISQYTKAKFLNGIGKKTPVFVRFSLTNSDLASPDTALDDRGVAIKFYTEDGNHDLVAFDTITFPIRDPMLFPQLGRSRRRNPATNLRDRNIWWDFVSQRPEATLNLLEVLSDDGKRDGYRRTQAFGVHAFKLVNADGEYIWGKFRASSLTPATALTLKEMIDLQKNDTEYFSRDLYNAIERGEYPQWNVTIQIMTLDQAKNYTRNPFDITRFWFPREDFPQLPVGILTLDKGWA